MEQQPFPLLALPDLVLQHVLTFLSLSERKACRATCTKLSKVASSAVRHFHVEASPGDTCLQYLTLHEKFPNIQVISLSEELVCDRPFAALVTLSLCKLKNLSCILLLNRNMALSAAGMAALTQCKQIKQLVLAPPLVVKGPLVAANTEAIATVISQLPGLTHLLLMPNRQQEAAAAAGLAGAAVPGVQATGLNHIAQPRDWQLNNPALGCLGVLHGLVQLEVGCDPSSLVGLGSLVGLSNLRRLALRGLNVDAGDQLAVLARLPALRSLSLAQGRILEETLTHIGRCSRLTRLELQGCYQLREASLVHLAPLHWLACFRCSMTLSETGLGLLIAAAGSRLALLEADSIELAMAAHAGGDAGGWHYAHLQQESVPTAATAGGGGGGSPTPHFGQLGPQFPVLRVLQVRRLLGNCPQLWQLAPGLTCLAVLGEANNAGLTRALSGHCNLERLVLGCGTTSDAGLGAVGGLSRLRDLTLADGAAISAERLINIVQRLEHLRALQLSHMRNLNDESLAHLVVAARQLQLLGLQEPGRVSDQGFALLAGFSKLKHLWLDCCKLSTAVAMALACSASLSVLEVHQSHPEGESLEARQLELLSRVKGPQTEVIVCKGPRSREEIMRPQVLSGSASLCRIATSRQTFASQLSLGVGGQDMVLDHGLIVDGYGARALVGQVGAGQGTDGVHGDDLWPDMAEMHL